MVYESLTPDQRVVACVEALSRGDDNERLRLIRSCPKLTYVQTDVRFSEAMEGLMCLAMAVEADLKEHVLRFLFFAGVDPEISGSFLQDFANVRAAWRMALTSMGIDEEAMASAGPPTSPVFELIEVLLPKPDFKTSEILSAEMLDYLVQ
ncbi:hypothetical protein [Ruegeria sp. AU67]|uniref:hypothetical protein n=1 Tax=Ruegeria sp. AU67 TaxID=2108530 RepID=UPI001359BF0D|nr:hypothetical protein [Ruegeria sp. AU67]